MSKKTLPAIGALVVIVIASCVFYTSFRRQPTFPANASASVSRGAFDQIKVGMSQREVQKIIGRPSRTEIYNKFEHKTPAQWQQLEAKVAAERSKSSYDSVPSIEQIHDATELTHQYHDVWSYLPNPSTTANLYFAEDGTLLKIIYQAVPKIGTPSGRNSGGQTKQH